MKHLRRIASCVLIAAMLLSASALTACGGKTEPTETTGETRADTEPASSADTGPASEPATEPGTEPGTDPQETETDAPADPMEGYLPVAGDGVSVPAQILLPDYPALWETAAADALKARLLSLCGVEARIVGRGETADEGGFTLKLGPAAGTAVDEAALGNAGYTVRVADGGLIVYAMTDAAMTEALGVLAEQLVMIDGRAAVKADLSVTEKKDAAPTGTPVTDGTWGESIAYAHDMANDLNSAFTDGSRRGYMISNSTMTLVYDLNTKDAKHVDGLYNSNGVPYLTDTMDVFLTTTNGEVLWASRSMNAARVNMFRLGYYYRDCHMMDQNFTAGELPYDKDTAVSLLTKQANWSGNMISKIVKDKQTYAISYTVEDNADPYLSEPVNFDTKVYNAIRLEVRCEAATGGQLYFNNGSGYSEAQSVSFQLNPGEDFESYIIILETMPNYTAGKAKGIRFDIGARVGEKVEIRALEAVTVKSEIPLVNLDRVYHTYSDKLHEQLHFVCTGAVNTLASYGTEVRLDASTVNGLCVIDANGAHDALSDVDWTSVEAAAFDVARAGVIGWILPQTSVDALTVTLTDGAYVLTIEHTEPSVASYKALSQFSIGWRIYNDDGHSFDTFIRETYVERNPIDIGIFKAEDGARAVGYDPLRGCYEFTVQGVDFTTAYNHPQKSYRVNAVLKGDDVDRKLYVMTHEMVGCLENVVVLDDSELLLPISPEVTKNFGHEKEEPLYDQGDTTYGEGIFPLILSAGETRAFSVLHLYQNWGKHALKQLSSIQFVSPYYHLSCGCTETNCIAPYYVYGKDYWTLPDFRAWSAPMWSNQPQHTSIGRLYWLQYTDADGNWYGSDFTEDTISSSGPTYADITMDYLSDDGRIAASYRHMETPQTDENRTYYEVDLTVLRDLTIKDFRNDFSFFSFDGRSVAFSMMGYVNEDGEEVVEETNKRDHSDIIRLGEECPYFDYYIGDVSDYVCFALLVRDARIVINGVKTDARFVIKEEWTGSLNKCYLSLDLGEVTLKAGDTIHIDMILMPWGSQLKKDDENVRTVRADSCLYPIAVTAEVGQVLDDPWMPQIMAENNTAVFTVEDGGGAMAVRVYGLTGWGRPVIETLIGGEWVPYVVNVHDYDGYMVYAEDDGTFSVSFIIDTGTSLTRTLRVTGQ